MDEKRLAEIENRLDGSDASYAGQDIWAFQYGSGMPLTVADVRALIAEVRRLQAIPPDKAGDPPGSVGTSACGIVLTEPAPPASPAPSNTHP